MAKNVVQDIVPPERRSIRNIPVPNRGNRSSDPMTDVRRTAATAPVMHREQSDVPIEIREWEKKSEPSYDHYNNGGNSSSPSPFQSKKCIWISSALALVIVVIAVVSLFSGATVTITAKGENASSAETFTASRDTAVPGVEYQIVKISKDLGKSVPASGQEQVERKASGQITIYNNFNATEQRLIKNTRFQTPEGLIYRINESVVVPGKKDATTPGSVTVTVFADEAGEKHNIGLKDFSIPGFKGDPKFTSIVARSKSEMIGGFIGTVKKVSEADKATASSELDSSITSMLKTEILAQVPADFVLYPDAMFFEYESLDQTGGDANSVELNRRGTLTGVMIQKSVLAEFLASTLVQNIPKTGIRIANIETLPFIMTNKQTFNPNTSTSFGFTISGPVKFVSVIDTEKIALDLVGKSRSGFTAVLESYPGILYGKEKVSPFWKRSFPTKTKDISISVEADAL